MLAIAIAAVTSAGVYALARTGVHQGYAPAQPIAFSHKLHAGDNQVPCLYCHFGATTSRHAGIPPINVCMNCHNMLAKQSIPIEQLKETVQRQQPVAWTKVHNLPDFVYFNHSRHIVASVACASCHGHVETMTTVAQTAPLTMGWCIQCHRERHGGDPQGTATNLDCGKCHY